MNCMRVLLFMYDIAYCSDLLHPAAIQLLFQEGKQLVSGFNLRVRPHHANAPNLAAQGAQTTADLDVELIQQSSPEFSLARQARRTIYKEWPKVGNS